MKVGVSSFQHCDEDYLSPTFYEVEGNESMPLAVFLDIASFISPFVLECGNIGGTIGANDTSIGVGRYAMSWRYARELGLGLK